MATHGDNAHLLSERISGERFPYVCHGHTHCIRDEQFDSVRVICPQLADSIDHIAKLEQEASGHVERAIDAME